MEKPKSVNCPVFLDNLQRFVDGDMPKKEQVEFMNSIHDHIECIQVLEMEQAYKQFICSRLERKCCSETFLLQIRTKISEE